VTTWFAFLLGETFAPGYATRYMAGRSIRDTKIGIAGIGVVLGLTFPFVILFIALYARTHFPGLDSQHALPAVVKELNNPVFASVMIAALLSAVMSSADSALNSATAIFTKDLFEHQLGWGHKGDQQILKIARRCTIALGLTSTLVAWWKPDIIDLLLFTYHIWAPSIFLPVVVGVLSKRRGPALNRAIYQTILISLVATLIYRITAYSKNLDSAVFGVGVSIVVYGILSTIYGVYRDPDPR
jgi:SSS family solute:Na+ symporter